MNETLNKLNRDQRFLSQNVRRKFYKYYRIRALIISIVSTTWGIYFFSHVLGKQGRFVGIFCGEEFYFQPGVLLRCQLQYLKLVCCKAQLPRIRVYLKCSEPAFDPHKSPNSYVINGVITFEFLKTDRS